MQRFAPIEYTPRVQAVNEWLESDDNECDALLLLNLVDIRWLTGFTGSNGWAVVRSGSLTFGTDTRYGERAADETKGSGAQVIAVQARAALHQAMVSALDDASCVGLDARTTPHAQWSALAADLVITPTGSPVTKARQVKDGAELERIEAAAAAADAALAEVEPILKATLDSPVTEADIRNELEYRMRLHGADDRSYNTIVASGPDHAARPHHEVASRQIVAGDTVVIDVGALVEGYHSDMTRSYVIGEPTSQQREVYDVVQESQTAGLLALHDGVTAKQVDAASRAVCIDAGYSDWYLHGTGHGVGLEIHESPFHSPASAETITENNVVTIEPGLYRGGFGGYRIEDLAVVTATGHRILTHHPKTPFTA